MSSTAEQDPSGSETIIAVRRCADWEDPYWDHEPPPSVIHPCPTLRALALPYADHPEFREEWRCLRSARYLTMSSTNRQSTPTVTPRAKIRRLSTVQGVSAPCPFCGLEGGFHDEDIHAARPCLKEKSLPLRPDDVVLCRACGEPLRSSGAPGCRYPNHASADAA